MFAPVAESPDAWRYKTVSDYGRMWGIGYRFAQPPETVESFERRGRTLTGTGSGRVTLELSSGREVIRDLPFRLRLPDGA
jgi:hypothetical protein